MQEYNLARDQGYQGSFLDFKNDLEQIDQSQLSELDRARLDKIRAETAYLGAAKSTLRPATVTALETDIRTAKAGLDRIKSVSETYDDRFLQRQTQLQIGLATQQDKIGMATEGQKKLLEDYTAFKVSTLDNLNRYIKEITGAAMSVQEAERITKSMPNMDMSPTEFKKAMSTVVSQLEDQVERAERMIAQGISPVTNEPISRPSAPINPLPNVTSTPEVGQATSAPGAAVAVPLPGNTNDPLDLGIRGTQ